MEVPRPVLLRRQLVAIIFGGELLESRPSLSVGLGEWVVVAHSRVISTINIFSVSTVQLGKQNLLLCYGRGSAKLPKIDGRSRARESPASFRHVMPPSDLLSLGTVFVSVESKNWVEAESGTENRDPSIPTLS